MMILFWCNSFKRTQFPFSHLEFVTFTMNGLWFCSSIVYGAGCLVMTIYLIVNGVYVVCVCVVLFGQFAVIWFLPEVFVMDVFMRDLDFPFISIFQAFPFDFFCFFGIIFLYWFLLIDVDLRALLQRPET